MTIGLDAWSAEHSTSSGDNPRNSGLLYGYFSGRSEPPEWSPLEPPAIMPPIKLATADFTRVSMILRGSWRCVCVSSASTDRGPARRRSLPAREADPSDVNPHSARLSLGEHGNRDMLRATRWSCDKPVAAGGFGVAGRSLSCLQGWRSKVSNHPVAITSRAPRCRH